MRIRPFIPSFLMILLLQFSTLSAQSEVVVKTPLALTVGGDFRDDGKVLTVGCEWLWGKRLALNPAIGIGASGNDLTGSGFADGTFWKLAGTLRTKYYILLHKRHPLEGIYAFVHLGYFRRSLRIKPDSYIYYRNYRSEFGLGIGGQWVIRKRFILGGNAATPWSTGSDWLGNPDGSTWAIYRRTGFVVVGSLQLGMLF